MSRDPSWYNKLCRKPKSKAVDLAHELREKTNATGRRQIFDTLGIRCQGDFREQVPAIRSALTALVGPAKGDQSGIEFQDSKVGEPVAREGKPRDKKPAEKPRITQPTPRETARVTASRPDRQVSSGGGRGSSEPLPFFAMDEGEAV